MGHYLIIPFHLAFSVGFIVTLCTLRTINHCEPGSLSSGKCFDCQATTTSLHNSKNMLCSILLAIILCAPMRKASRGGMLATQHKDIL